MGRWLFLAVVLASSSAGVAKGEPWCKKTGSVSYCPATEDKIGDGWHWVGTVFDDAQKRHWVIEISEKAFERIGPSQASATYRLTEGGHGEPVVAVFDCRDNKVTERTLAKKIAHPYGTTGWYVGRAVCDFRP